MFSSLSTKFSLGLTTLALNNLMSELLTEFSGCKGLTINEITILLSTSDIESYGLAIREAILRGKKCVAVTSVGARDAKENFSEGITLAKLDPIQIAQSIASEIESNKSTLNLESVRNKQEIMNASYVSELVSTWR